MNSRLFEDSWNTERKAEAERLTKLFLDTPREHRYIYGQNVYAAAVAKEFGAAAVIDDFASESRILNTPMIQLHDVPLNSVILNAVGGRTQTAKQNLDKLGLANIDYFAFARFCNGNLPEIVFNEGFEPEFSTNSSKFDWVYRQLADEQSRETFRKLVSFRLTSDLHHLDGFKNREDEQYFEEFIEFNVPNPTFIDVGGFDGFTSNEFMSRFPDYGRVVIIEPEALNFETCVKAFAEKRGLSVHKLGLGADRILLKISSGGSGSRVGDIGDQEVEIVALDDLIQELGVEASYIKMDIEGYELNALRGSISTIEHEKPLLAISVYHDPKHFWQVPELILSVHRDYAIYVRHYTESIYETIMYFVPKQSS